MPCYTRAFLHKLKALADVNINRSVFKLRLEEVCFAHVLQQTITQLAFTLAYFCSETLFTFLSQGDKHGATCQGLPSASQLAADSLSRDLLGLGPAPDLGRNPFFREYSQNCFLARMSLLSGGAWS
jgi:hypothetical protein